MSCTHDLTGKITFEKDLVRGHRLKRSAGAKEHLGKHNWLHVTLQHDSTTSTKNNLNAASSAASRLG
jgi:hypothetical protein